MSNNQNIMCFFCKATSPSSTMFYSGQEGNRRYVRKQPTESNDEARYTTGIHEWKKIGSDIFIWEAHKEMSIDDFEEHLKDKDFDYVYALQGYLKGYYNDNFTNLLRGQYMCMDCCVTDYTFPYFEEDEDDCEERKSEWYIICPPDFIFKHKEKIEKKQEKSKEKEKIYVCSKYGWQFVRENHTSLYDRGWADSYYDREPSPHYGMRDERVDVTDSESVKEYMIGFNNNQKSGERRWVKPSEEEIEKDKKEQEIFESMRDSARRSCVSEPNFYPAPI